MSDFFEQLKEWGFDLSEFKATEFDVVDLIHPDDVITQATDSRVSHTESLNEVHPTIPSTKVSSDKHLQQALKSTTRSRVKEEDCTIIACGPKGTSAVAYGEIFHTDHPNHIGFQLNDKLAPGSYSYLIIIDGVGLICTCLVAETKEK